MSNVDPFIVFWCAVVGLIVLANVVLAVHDLRMGSSRLVVGHGERITRAEQPFGFWLAISGKLLTLPVGALMIWFVLGVVPR